MWELSLEMHISYKSSYFVYNHLIIPTKAHCPSLRAACSCHSLVSLVPGFDNTLIANPASDSSIKRRRGYRTP